MLETTRKQKIIQATSSKSMLQTMPGLYKIYTTNNARIVQNLYYKQCQDCAKSILQTMSGLYKIYTTNNVRIVQNLCYKQCQDCTKSILQTMSGLFCFKTKYCISNLESKD